MNNIDYNKIAEMVRIGAEIEEYDGADARIEAEEGLIIDAYVNLYNAGYRKESDIQKEIGEQILNLAEECGGGVLFYQKMRKLASQLTNEVSEVGEQ